MWRPISVHSSLFGIFCLMRRFFSEKSSPCCRWCSAIVDHQKITRARKNIHVSDGQSQLIRSQVINQSLINNQVIGKFNSRCGVHPESAEHLSLKQSPVQVDQCKIKVKITRVTVVNQRLYQTTFDVTVGL